MRFTPSLLALLALPLAAVAAPEPAAAAAHVIDVYLEYVDRQTGTEITIVPVGTTVTWQFQVLAHPRSADSDVTISEGGVNAVKWQSGRKPAWWFDTYSYTFLTRGVFVYDCEVHGAMQGYIVVR